MEEMTVNLQLSLICHEAWKKEKTEGACESKMFCLWTLIEGSAKLPGLWIATSMASSTRSCIHAVSPSKVAMAATAAPPLVKEYEIEVSLDISVCEEWSQFRIYEGKGGTWWGLTELWHCVQQLLGCIISWRRDRSWQTLGLWDVCGDFRMPS